MKRISTFMYRLLAFDAVMERRLSFDNGASRIVIALYGGEHTDDCQEEILPFDERDDLIPIAQLQMLLHDNSVACCTILVAPHKDGAIDLSCQFATVCSLYGAEEHGIITPALA